MVIIPVYMAATPTVRSTKHHALALFITPTTGVTGMYTLNK